MLTVEKIYTGADILGDVYMDPQDARKTPPPELPERNKIMSPKPPQLPPKSAKIQQKQVPIQKRASKNPCLNVNQRRVVKYNLLLSMTINVLVMALGGTGFVSMVSGTHQENQKSYKYGEQILVWFRFILGQFFVHFLSIFFPFLF